MDISSQSVAEGRLVTVRIGKVELPVRKYHLKEGKVAKTRDGRIDLRPASEKNVHAGIRKDLNRPGAGLEICF